MDITNCFRDTEFRNFVIQKYCNGNLYIRKGDVENITELILPKQNYMITENSKGETVTKMTSGFPITSLAGIEHFTALEVLICSGNSTIKEVDISKNKRLRVFHCSGNKLTTLPLKNSTIEEIDCSHNPIEKQNFSIFPQLKILNCGVCQLSEISVSKNTELEILICRYNPIKELDTSNNFKLKVLDCNNTKYISYLQLKKNIYLEELDCGFNSLSGLDISNLTKLKKIVCYHNKLTELHLQNNKQVEYLSCMTNRLMELDICNNIELKLLDCSENQLSELDVSKNTKLEILDCNHNQLKKIDLVNNTALTVLKVFNNQLREIDVSKNTVLERFICSDNQLISVPNVSTLKKLDYFSYSGNPIPEPDFTVKGVGKFVFDIHSTDYSLINDSLSITVSVSNLAGIKKLSTIIKKVINQLENFKSEAIKFIGEKYPEEDSKELILSDIVFDADKTFRLGFDAGDSPAGRLYLYLEFDRNLNMKEEIIYETY